MKLCKGWYVKLYRGGGCLKTRQKVQCDMKELGHQTNRYVSIGVVSYSLLFLLFVLFTPITSVYGQSGSAWPTYFLTAAQCNGVRKADLSLPTPLPAGQRVYMRLVVWNGGIAVTNSFVIEYQDGSVWKPVDGSDPAATLMQKLNNYSDYDDIPIAGASSAVEWERFIGNPSGVGDAKYVLDITDFLKPGRQYRIRNKENVFHLGLAMGPVAPVPTNFVYGSQADIVPASGKPPLFYKDEAGTWVAVPIVAGKREITMCKGGKLVLSASETTPDDPNDFFNYEWTPGSKIAAPSKVKTVTIKDVTRPLQFTVTRKGVCAADLKEVFDVKIAPRIDPIIEIAGLSSGHFCGSHSAQVTVREVKDATKLEWAVMEDGHGTFIDQQGTQPLPAVTPPTAPQPIGTPINFNYYSHNAVKNTTGDPMEHELRVIASNGACSGVKTLKVKVYPPIIRPVVTTTVSSPVGGAGCSPLDITFKDTQENNQKKGVTYYWELGTAPDFVPSTSHATSPFVTAENTGSVPLTFHSKLVVADKSGTCKEEVSTLAGDYQPVVVNPGVVPLFDFMRVPDQRCTPVLLRLEDKTTNSTWREWRLTEPVDATHPTPGAGQFWSRAMVGSNDFYVVNPFEVTEKRKRFLEMTVGNAYCQASKKSEIEAYPPPTANPMIVTRIGTDCWPYRFKLRLENIGNTSSIEWQVDMNGGTGAASPATGTFALGAGVTAWEQEFEFANAGNIPANWTVVVTLISPVDACTKVYKENINVGARVITALENADPVGCPDDASGNRKVVITDKSEYALGSNREWSLNGTPIVPVDLGSNRYELTLQNTSTTATVNHVVSLAIDDGTGCRQSSSIQFTLYPRVAPDFELNYVDPNGTTQIFAPNTVLCPDVDGTLKALNVVAGSRYEWQISNPATTPPQEIFGEGENYNYKFTNETATDLEYTVTLKAINEKFCSQTISKKYGIHPSIKAEFTVKKLDECTPYKIQYIDQTKTKVNPYTKTWSVDGGTEEAPGTDIYIYNTPGTKNIRLDVSTGHCASSATYSFDVLPQVMATIATVLPTDKVCAPAQLTFTNSSQNSTRHEWTFEVGSTSPVRQNGPDIKYTFTNVTDAPKIVTVLLQSYNDRNCKAEATTQVTVYPEPRPINSYKITDKCFPFKLEFLSNSGSLLDYEWTFTPIGTGASSGSQRVITGQQNGSPVEVTLANTSLHDFVKYEITYKGSKSWGGGVTCAVGPVRVDEVVVPPKLELTLGVQPRPDNLHQELCSGELPLIFDIHTKGGAHVAHTWDFGDGANTQVSYNDDFVDHQFENKTQEDKTCHVKVISVQEETLCKVETSLDVLVHPEVVALFTKEDGNICETPRKITFTNSSRGNIGGLAAGVSRDFHWDYGYMEGGVQQQEILHATGEHVWLFPNNAPNTDATMTVKLTVEEKYATGKVCRSGAPATADVLVAPKLIPNFTVDKAIACIPFPVVLTNLSTGAPKLNYVWDYDDGNTGSDSNPTHTHTYGNTALNAQRDYKIKLTIENSVTRCVASTEKIVKACPKVMADFSLDNTVFCTPGNVRVVNNSRNATTYNWNILGGVGSTIPPTTTLGEVIIPVQNPTTSDKKVKLQLIATATYANNVVCKDTKEQELTLRAEIRADFDFAEAIGCSPMKVKITNKSKGAKRYRWYIDGEENQSLSAELHPSFELVNRDINGTPKEFEVKLLALNGDCSAEVTKKVTVYPVVNSKIILDKYSGCTPLNVKAKVGEQNANYSYEWSATQGTVAIQNGAETSAIFTNTTVSPAQILEGAIRLKVYFTSAPQCKSEVEEKVKIYPGVYPDFVPPQPGCAPYDARFQLSTNVFSSAETEYTWSVDGVQVLKEKEATPADPVLRLINNDNTLDVVREVTLHVRSVHGCEGEKKHSVTVYPKPKALFEVNGKSEGCPPFDVEFLNLSKGAGLNFTYEYGDGSSVSVSHSNPVKKQYTHTLDKNVVYTVKLKAVSNHGCVDEQTSVVTVYPAAHADFDISPSDKGCSPLMVKFENRSNKPVSKLFTWDFGDGTVPHEMDEPEHVYENLTVNDVVYVAKLKARTSQGCESELSKNVTVYATPKARFKVLPMLQVYPSANVTLTNLSSPAPSNWKYKWNFGDGTTSSLRDPATHQYSRWGLKSNDFAFDISLLVESPLCKSEEKVKAYILPPYPDPTFTAHTYEGCVPFRLTLLRDSRVMHDEETYLWEFGDGETSTEKVPVHDYKKIGTYHVKLTVTGDGGVNYAFAVVYVLPNPKVSFTLYPEQVMLPKATIKGQNKTEGDNLSFMWNFGDGEYSNDRSPIHTYTSAGKFLVTLEATNTQLADCRSSDTLSMIVRPAGNLVFPNVFQPSNDGSNGGLYSENDRANEVFHPYGEGVSDYILRVYDRWGEQIFESDDIKRGWDGYTNGRLCETGVYTWRATGHFFNGEVFDLRGNVTLLRK